MGDKIFVNDKPEKYMPFKKYIFPAGVSGGEIRVTIPAMATKEDVEQMACCINAIAERWKGIGE